MGSHPIGLEVAADINPPASLSTQTVTVYTRHQESCPKNGEPYWKRCHCMKYLYVYRENTSRQVSAKTRSWERAEERAQESRDSFGVVAANVKAKFRIGSKSSGRFWPRLPRHIPSSFWRLMA